MSATSLALSNLRAIVILIVLGFHSILAYLGSLPSKPPRFDAPPYDWQAFPIIDSQRWFGFDLFCAWNDVGLMSLMFFLSGLFAWPSLVRKQSFTFLIDRLLRLALPMIPAIFVLMPVALYPVYLVTTPDPSVADYWHQFLALPFWPCGPQWFLWQLLILNIIAAVLHKLYPSWGDHLGKLAASTRPDPTRFILVLTAASAMAYVPMALIYSPWSWFQYSAFAFQWSRPLHYTIYFFAGAAVGAYGLERGLLATDGALARRWPIAVAAAVTGLALWMTPTALIMGSGGAAPLWLELAADVGFVVCCASGCLALMAVCIRFATNRHRWLDSLSANAYGMYLVHYPFVVWMQYALLKAPLPAMVKAAIVFGVTLASSWATVAALRSVPLGARLVGAGPRALAKAR
ncbi:MAG: acyltransferase family protein [Rhizobiales bacterium]|nr:acyltransferase family protein [Hyphomicrobiales bacterium]